MKSHIHNLINTTNNCYDITNKEPISNNILSNDTICCGNIKNMLEIEEMNEQLSE